MKPVGTDNPAADDIQNERPMRYNGGNSNYFLMKIRIPEEH